MEIYDPFPSPKGKVSSGDEEVDGWGGGEEEGKKLEPLVSVGVGSRFCRLSWGGVGVKGMGVVGAGFENGEIGLWDPEVLLKGGGEG